MFKWVIKRYRRRPQRRKSKHERELFVLHKEKARALVLSLIAQENLLYQYEIKKVAIRNQSTRWGSCSTKGNLNFNFKIIFLPPALARYIVVHELCHLKEFNHGSDFWKLVSLACPNYALEREELRRISPLLTHWNVIRSCNS
jgi:hypothetical protein